MTAEHRGPARSGPPHQIHRRVLMTATLVAFAGFSGRAVAADPIRLGAVLPLTGPSASTGAQEQRGLQFAVTRFNAAGGAGGRMVEIIYEDNQGRPDQSVLAFNKLADLNQVPVIFTGYTGPTLAMAPLAGRKKVLLVNGAAQGDRLANASPYLINTLPVVRDEAAVAARYLIEIGKKRAAILYQNDAAMTSGRDDFATAFTKLGGTILGEEQSSFSQTDFRPALLKLTSLEPDVLFVMLTDGLGAFAEQVEQAKPEFTIAGTSFFADPTAMRRAGSKGWVHTQVRVKAPPEVAESFKQQTGADMDFFGIQYANAGGIVLRTIGNVLSDKGELSGEAIRAKLFAIKDFNELMPTSFHTNTASMQIDVMRISNGKDDLVKSYTSD